jgi:hypothetical protein
MFMSLYFVIDKGDITHIIILKYKKKERARSQITLCSYI